MSEPAPEEFVFSEESVARAPRILVDGTYLTYGPWGVRMTHYSVPGTYQPHPPSADSLSVYHAEAVVSLSWQQVSELAVTLTGFLEAMKRRNGEEVEQ